MASSALAQPLLSRLPSTINSDRDLMEDKMNNFPKLSFVIAAAGASVAASMIFSAPAKADVSLLQKCTGSNRLVVERCGASWVRQKGVPIWMAQSPSSCSNATSCSVKISTRTGVAAVAVKKPYCWIAQAPVVSKSSPPPPPPPPPQTRGNIPGRIG
jgi:hypothetical protein